MLFSQKGQIILPLWSMSLEAVSKSVTYLMNDEILDEMLVAIDLDPVAWVDFWVSAGALDAGNITLDRILILLALVDSVLVHVVVNVSDIFDRSLDIVNSPEPIEHNTNFLF